MKGTSLALFATLVLVALALVPTLFVLVREALRRVATARAIADVEAARRAIGAPGGDVAALAERLRTRVPPIALERAILDLLRHEDVAMSAWGATLFRELGFAEKYAKVLREAPKWSARAHAAEVLGLARAVTAIPALVAALRDRTEDDVSVKVAAAGALARLKDEAAIPLLVAELHDVDARSSRTVAEALTAFGALAVPELLACLADAKSAEARVWAARILGRIKDARATDDLVARLYDRDDRLRMAAAEALGEIGDPRALQSLVRATLRDPAPQVRAHAAGAVAQIEGPRALDILVAALADPDYGARLRALEAFETMRLDDTAPLEAALRDPNADVRRRAALALERVGHLERVVRDLTAEDRVTRDRAYAALLSLGREGLADSIASYVHHVSFQVRALAAQACGELGFDRAAPILIPVLDDPEWPVRAAACEALGRLKHEKVPAALAARLLDPVDVVQEAAAEALTSYGPAELEPHLEALLAAYDAGTVVMRTAMVVLVSRLSGEMADALLVRASADPSDAVRLRAVPALGDRGGRVLEQPLVARLDDPSLDVRMAAVTALGSATSPEAFEGLLRALGGAAPDARDRIAEALSRGARAVLFQRLPELEDNPSLDVRIGVAWTLGKTGAPEAVPTLAKFLRDEAAPLRASAAGALAKIPTASALDALVSAANDPDGRVRAAVVNALGRATDPSDAIVAALERRARDPDPFVRNRALVSLARTGGARVEASVRALADGADPAARTVAFALLDTESALASALDGATAEGALDRVVTFLAKEDPAVRTRFFRALHLEEVEVIDDPRGDLATRYAQVVRSSLDVDARRLAVAALGRLHGPRVVEVLGDAVVGDPDETVRLRAANALVTRTDEPAARAALVRAVGDPNVDVVRVTLAALSRRREPEVAAALVRRLGAVPNELVEPLETAVATVHADDPMPFLDWMMGHDVPELLVPAVRVLGRIAHPSTLPLLRELARSRSDALRAASVTALAKLPGAEVARAIEELAQDPSEDVRIAVLEATTWTPDAVLRTAAVRRDPVVRVRAAAARSLARAIPGGERSAMRALEGMLDDASPVVRAAALVSLVALGPGEALLAFGRAWPTTALEVRLALRDDPRRADLSVRLAAILSSTSDVEQRRCAVVAIGAIGSDGFHVHVLPALADPSPAVRLAAIQSLAAVDEQGVRARIRELLSDPDPTIRDAARRSLVRTVG